MNRFKLFHAFEPVKFFLFTELGSSSDLIHGFVATSISAAYYRDAQGYLIPMIAGSFHNVAADDEFIIGIIMHDLIYAIYDDDKRQIVIREDNQQQVRMDRELHEYYDHHFVRLSPPTPQHSPHHWPSHLPPYSPSQLRNQRRRHN